jgi:RNA polymerase sigma-70 factor (ECF subfamily)
MPESDASLMRLAASGQAGSFLALMGRHGQAIHAYLARRCGRDAADDLLSEVFLRAYAARGTFDGRRHNARPWLYGIARNVLHEHWRQSGAADLKPILIPTATHDPWSEVDARLDAAARLPGVRLALAGLAPGDREVLLLVAWEGLTPAEAAGVLGIPPGTARSRLHRARQVMRRLLDHDTAAPAAATYQEA